MVYSESAWVLAISREGSGETETEVEERNCVACRGAETMRTPFQFRRELDERSTGPVGRGAACGAYSGEM